MQKHVMSFMEKTFGRKRDPERIGSLYYRLFFILCPKKNT